MDAANQLTVGPMGFGGKTSLIGCKIGALNRLPASFFVSIAYDCWAFRRLGVTLDARSGAITSWLYRDGDTPSVPMLTPEQLAAGFPRTGREVRLQAPITDEQIRALKVGDVVLISGRMYTGRDAVHAHLMKHEPPVDLRGGVLYHCGPVVVKEQGAWRLEGHGRRTDDEHPRGAVPGRHPQALRRARRDRQGRDGREDARRPEGVRRGLPERRSAARRSSTRAASTASTGVSLMEFGTPEAMWHLDVTDFPAIVTMDAHGNSLHKDIEQASGERLATVAASLGTSRRCSANSPQRRHRIDAAIEVDPHGAAIVRFERLEVADRLRALQLRERERRVRDRRLGLVLAGDHERDASCSARPCGTARSSAGSAARRRRCSRVRFCARIAVADAARPPVSIAGSAGRYDRNAT